MLVFASQNGTHLFKSNAVALNFAPLLRRSVRRTNQSCSVFIFRRAVGRQPSVLLTIRMFAWHEEIRLQSERRVRDRQRQNTNRILNHGGHGDHGRNRRKYTVSVNSRIQSHCPVIEPLVLRVLRALRGKIKIKVGCGLKGRAG